MSDSEQSALISFPDVSEADSNKLAASLLPALRETDRSVSVERRKTNVESQDFGATLVLVLGTSAISALAKGVATWLARNSGTTIEISAPDGTTVKVKHGSGQDTAETVKAALSRKR